MAMKMISDQYKGTASYGKWTENILKDTKHGKILQMINSIDFCDYPVEDYH